MTISLEIPTAREDHTDALMWTFTLAMAVLVSGWMVALGWTVLWSQIVLAMGPSALLAGMGRWYATRDDGLSRICYSVALLLALFFFGEMATYVAGAYSLPFLDDTLARADRVLGFDWATWVAWLRAHPALDTVARLVYPQHLLQTAFTVMWLAHRGTANRFLRAIALAFLVSLAGEVLLPAVGTMPDVPGATVRVALRAGTFHTYDVATTAGLISMPSFHAVLAVLAGVAWWPSRARWFVVAFNAVLIVATLSEGGHYLVDVLAGIAVALWAAHTTRMARV